MVNISIIGTANRDNKPLTVDLYYKMINVVKYMLQPIIKNNISITLISGGAAWADHIAITLYLEGFIDNLILHLPCNFIIYQYDTNCSAGKTSNNLHRNFSSIVNINSLEEINLAIQKGAKVIIHNGFYARNKYVANECDYLIALTGSTITGGTFNTWNQCSVPKYHVDIFKL